MLDLTRRALLRRSILGTLAMGGASVLPRSAWATGWGDIPAGVWPAAYQPKKVLEIFCYSGMSPWETFWVSEDTAATKNWRNFQADVQGLHWHCAPDSASPSDETNSFATDQGGTPVFWGPSTKPLWRADIFGRARMVTIAHDLQPHEAATPLALTGHRLGNPRLAGKGAAIQHRQISLMPRAVPYSFVLVPDDIGGFQFAQVAAVTNGMHPGYAVPMLIKIGDSSFQTLLQRSQMTSEADHLIATYQGMYRDRLRFQGMGDAIRSAGFTSYDTAVNFLLNADQLDTLLGGSVLTVGNGRICGTDDPAEPAQAPNKTATALEVATLLLTTGQAAYVGVLDGGVTRVAGTPYDTHYPHHVETVSSNMFNLCRNLAAQIDAADPTKLNLDDVLIVIHSEFGRTPTVGGLTGRDHWPYGYVAILIGGPIASRGIEGHLDGASSMPNAGNDYSPTDVHGAVLLAAGIDPFASENFGVQEFTTNVNDGTEQGTRLNLKTKILGA
ncbi:MAG TPA: DUF1501 domain-containing protein [Candidatus Cybelea sp.]|nr:DUF1501 domain-containing protein [Candidatus Cybelea sp.]